jgi:hypothetical protein
MGFQGFGNARVRLEVEVRSGPLGVIAISVAAYVAPGENVISDLAKPLNEQQSVFLVGFLMRVLFLVLGIRMITEE